MRRIIILLLLFILAIVVGFWYWNTNIKKPPLGAQIFKSTQNPIKDKVSEVDVFQVKTNPFKDIYPNPFREKK